MPKAEFVFRMQHLPLPFFCTIELERVSNGKETKEIVIDVRPIEPVQVQPRPAQKVG